MGLIQPNTPSMIDSKKIVFLVESSANTAEAEKIANHLKLPMVTCSRIANHLSEFSTKTSRNTQSSKEINTLKTN